MCLIFRVYRQTVGKPRQSGQAAKCGRAFAAVLMCFYMSALTASAAEGGIAAVTDDGRNVYCYVRGVQGITEGAVQIGNVVCDDPEITALSDCTPPLRTVILLDNSASIKRGRRTDIKELMDGLIEGRLEGESFRIGTFNDSVNWLGDYSTDYEAVQESIDSITYKNQTTYFGDCLHQVLTEINEAGFWEYTRVIMISDGADNQKLGYTNLEVSAFVKESGIPVYTIGTPGDNDALETMFAFSRVSNAGWYLLDGSQDNGEILEGLEADRDMVCVRITPDESLLDGSQKQMRLALQTAGGETTLTTFVNMPMGEGRELDGNVPSASEKEPAAATFKQNQDNNDGESVLPTIVAESSPKEDKSDLGAGGIPMKDIIGTAIVIAAALVAAGLLFLLFYLLGKRSAAKKENGQNARRDTRGDQRNGSGGHSGASDRTRSLQEDNQLHTGDWPRADREPPFSGADYAHSGETVLLFGQSQGDFGVQTYLVLKDVERPSSLFKVAITKVVRIGRKDADIVIDYDKYISAGQCEIIKRGELLYIRDIGSTNGTYYDGMRVYDQEVPIVSGGTVQMGRSRFVITIVRE